MNYDKQMNKNCEIKPLMHDVPVSTSTTAYLVQELIVYLYTFLQNISKSNRYLYLPAQNKLDNISYFIYYNYYLSPFIF